LRHESRKGCDKWEMRAKIMSLFLTFFSSRTERKHMRVKNDYNIRVRNYYNLWRTKKIMRKKIKIILKNIWLNYSFDSCFGLKMLNWSSSF